HLHVQNVDLQCIADGGAPDVDGPSNKVRPWTWLQRFERSKVIARDQAKIIRQRLFAACGKAVERHGVAGADFQDGRRVAVQVAPYHVLWSARYLIAARHKSAPINFKKS